MLFCDFSVVCGGFFRLFVADFFGCLWRILHSQQFDVASRYAIGSSFWQAVKNINARMPGIRMLDVFMVSVIKLFVIETITELEWH